MKRSPLKRGAPLRRKTRMRQRRQPQRRSERVRDVPYMLAVKGLPCCAPPGWGRVAGSSYCAGPVEADHAGVRPAGRKCSDRETIPLCSWHHVCRTDHVGAFKGWTRAQMRAWLDARIAETQRTLAHLLPAQEAA